MIYNSFIGNSEFFLLVPTVTIDSGTGVSPSSIHI